MMSQHEAQNLADKINGGQLDAPHIAAG